MDYAAQDDETLVKLIAQANDEALSELYDRYGRLIFSIVLHMVGDQVTAEDIALDVFMRVWQKANLYRAHEGKARTWLTSIARHLAIDWLRKEGTRLEHRSISWEGEAANTAHHVKHAGDEGDEPERLVGFFLQRERIRAAVAQLPAEQKQALALAYFHGQTHRQIAEALDLPLGTVKTRIRLAMVKLGQLLENEIVC